MEGDGFGRPALVLVAAGASTRFGSGRKKEYLPIGGGTVLSEAAAAFFRAFPGGLRAVALAHPAGESPERAKAALLAGGALPGGTELLLVRGGATRQESVRNALESLAERLGAEAAGTLVLIHDGARPFVTEDVIRRTAEAAARNGAAAPGITPTDTQKEIGADGRILRHLVRSSLSSIQTPQAFVLEKILGAHREAARTGAEFTDDTEIWDRFSGGNAAVVVEGSAENRKITYGADLREGKMEIRTGLGYDKHPLVAGRRLVLGGVEIPSDLGEAGHSDGDVLLHAVIDALLGAAALGDIGSHFPPSDAAWKDADSRELLRAAWAEVKAEGWRLSNLDCVVALESPKFLPHRERVRGEIARVLGCGAERVSAKAKTGEKLGDVGERRAVEAWATCLIERG